MLIFKAKTTCPAKLNLSLKIALERRADSYHELESLMQMIDLADQLTLELYPGTGHSLDLEFDPELSRELEQSENFERLYAELKSADNLLIKAATAWFEAQAKDLPRDYACKWSLYKKTPLGAGLGGGSSDAVAALRLLNAFAKEAQKTSFTRRRKPRVLSDSELHDIAKSLGADLPFFLLDSSLAKASGIGTDLKPLDGTELKHYLVGIAASPYSTVEAYQKLDELRLAETFQAQPYANDFTLLYLDTYAELEASRKDLAALSLQLSGSGPSFFYSFNSAKEAKKALAEIQTKAKYQKLRQLRRWIYVQSLERPPAVELLKV
ncbi:MAG: hypothetical protein Q4P08_00765 [Eubacteriales bacterium]|nr:hypothetical protein [Eubacteriales bacterium]